MCSLHSEKLKLFCLEDKQAVYLVCRDSHQHDSPKFRPISEVVISYKEELKTALKSLQEKLKRNENMKGEFEKTAQHIKLSTQSVELNSNLRSFIGFSELKKKLQSLH